MIQLFSNRLWRSVIALVSATTCSPYLRPDLCSNTDSKYMKFTLFQKNSWRAGLKQVRGLFRHNNAAQVSREKKKKVLVSVVTVVVVGVVVTKPAAKTPFIARAICGLKAD